MVLLRADKEQAAVEVVAPRTNPSRGTNSGRDHVP